MQKSILWFSCSSFRVFLIRATKGKKGSQYPKSWTRTLGKELKPSIPQFAFNEVSLISKSLLRVVLNLF